MMQTEQQESAGSTAGTTAPVLSTDVASLQAEMRHLLDRLDISNEWNVRLNQQISELTQMPLCDIQAMRQRMLDPDIAVPLLQCYDAVIQEKTEEVQSLRNENARLEQQLTVFHRDQLDVSSAVKMAEELAKSVQGKASEEVQRYVQAVRELQEETVRLRLEVTRALDAENAAKQDTAIVSEKAAALEKTMSSLKEELGRAQEAQEAAERRCKQSEQQAGEHETGAEVQQVQLQLLKQENLDKAQELERLRAKMIQTLRQTSDNHAAHLRIVEERHRLVVEDLRSVNRTQELEMLKLRAQLARWDPCHSGQPRGSSGGHTSTSLGLQSTADLLEAQTRQAREMEVRRLYGEVAALQAQRDNAVRQYEQLTARLQRDRDQQLQEVQRQLQTAQRAAVDTRARCEELEEAKTQQEAALRQTREELRRTQQDAQQVRLSGDSQGRKLTTLQRQLAEATERIAAVEAEKKAAVQQEQQRAVDIERDIAQALNDAQAAKERAHEEVEALQRRYDQLQRAFQQAQDQLRERQDAVEKKERALSILEAQLGRLEEGLEAHKRRIVDGDRRAQALEAQLGEARQQQRGCFLTLEQVKLQNTQLTRARDQLADMLHARSF